MSAAAQGAGLCAPSFLCHASRSLCHRRLGAGHRPCSPAFDLANLQRAITQEVLTGATGSPVQMLAASEGRNTIALERAQRLLAEYEDAKSADLAMLSVAFQMSKEFGSSHSACRFQWPRPGRSGCRSWRFGMPSPSRSQAGL